MKKTKILYRAFTGLFVFFMISSAVPDVFSMPFAIKGMHDELGYPLYLIPFVGVAKLLGVAGILIPGFPRLKEWAYAGLMIDLGGALFSSLAVNVPPVSWLPLFIPIAFGILSYVYYHKSESDSTHI